MKKYTLVSFVFVLVFTLLVGFRFANALDSGCLAGDSFSRTTGQACSTTTLQIGSRGDAVKAFQQTLKNAGFLSGKVDGIYGKMTSAAATNYYKIHSPVQPPVTPISTPITNSTPTITSFSPASVLAGGTVTINGSNFSQNAQARLYEAPITPTYVSSSGTSLTFVVPSYIIAGTYSLAVIQSNQTAVAPSYLIVTGNSTTSLLPGCTSTSGYSTTTGNACDGSVPPTVLGCTTTSGYSSFNGVACDGSTPAPTPIYPAGCTSTSGYSTTTGLACNGSGISNPAFPVGCLSTSGYSSANGEACDGSTPIQTPIISYLQSAGCTSNIGTSYVSGNLCSATIPGGTVYVFGKNFTSDDKVYFGDGSSSVTPLFISSTSLSFTVPSNPGGQPSIYVGFYPNNGKYYVSNSVALPYQQSSVCTSGSFDPNTGFRCGCSSISGFSSLDGSSCAVN